MLLALLAIIRQARKKGFNDKHFSLFCYSISNEEKSFIKFAFDCQKYFFPGMLSINKDPYYKTFLGYS
jgi:hypothetical protein